ncbi:2092_t:CDS:1, partial [Funneliformis geosporum]
MESNLSKNDTTKRAMALYCNAYIDRVKIPLIIDSGSAEYIISLKLLKDLDMKITQALKTIMVNVNGEKRRPLGVVTNIPLKINNHIIPFDA